MWTNRWMVDGFGRSWEKMLNEHGLSYFDQDYVLQYLSKYVKNVTNWSSSLLLLMPLCIFHFFQMTGLFQYTMRLAIETEARFTSVERIQKYIDVSYCMLSLLYMYIYIYILYWHKSHLMKCFLELAQKNDKNFLLKKDKAVLSQLNYWCMLFGLCEVTKMQVWQPFWSSHLS